MRLSIRGHSTEMLALLRIRWLFIIQLWKLDFRVMLLDPGAAPLALQKGG
jgi:hypothetical protein